VATRSSGGGNSEEGASEEGASDGERSMGGDFSDLWDEGSMESDSDSHAGGEGGDLGEVEVEACDSDSEPALSSGDQGAHPPAFCINFLAVVMSQSWQGLCEKRRGGGGGLCKPCVQPHTSQEGELIPFGRPGLIINGLARRTGRRLKIDSPAFGKCEPYCRLQDLGWYTFPAITSCKHLK